VLGTGTTGLSLAAAPDWSGQMFVGVVLIASLAVSGLERRIRGGERVDVSESAA
jgi:ribose transport system permease protein